MTIDDETTDVLIGGYLSTEAAHEDYEAVLACGKRLWGAVVVSKDLEGNVSLEQTDHTVEEGAVGLGGVGFVVGLFAPPLLAATAIGAALGAVGGKALHKKIGSQVEKMAEETIPIGGAGLIVAYPHSVTKEVESAVARAVQKVIGEAEGNHVKALKGALADAQKKMAEQSAQGNG
jgi:arylsulfatase